MVNGLIAGLIMTIIVLVIIMSIIMNNLSYRIDELSLPMHYMNCSISALDKEVDQLKKKLEEKQINNCKNKYYDINKIDQDAIYIIKCLDKQLDGHVTKIDQEDHKLD